MQSNPTPAPQPAPAQRKPLVLFSCCCKLSELLELAKGLQEMKDNELAELAEPVPALAPAPH